MWGGQNNKNVCQSNATKYNIKYQNEARNADNVGEFNTVVFLTHVVCLVAVLDFITLSSVYSKVKKILVLCHSGSLVVFTSVFILKLSKSVSLLCLRWL